MTRRRSTDGSEIHDFLRFHGNGTPGGAALAAWLAAAASTSFLLPQALTTSSGTPIAGMESLELW